MIRKVAGAFFIGRKEYIFVYCIVIFLFDTFVRTISIVGAAALALAALPWLFKFIRSVKLPGFELELERMEQRIEADLPPPPPPALQANRSHVFLDVYERDPHLALAGLRIEIERRLRRLADNNDLKGQSSITTLLRDLKSRDIIGPKVASIISDMIPILNTAVHAKDVPPEAGEWVLKNGPNLLAALDAKYQAIDSL